MHGGETAPLTGQRTSVASEGDRPRTRNISRLEAEIVRIEAILRHMRSEEEARGGFVLVRRQRWRHRGKGFAL